MRKNKPKKHTDRLGPPRMRFFSHFVSLLFFFSFFLSNVLVIILSPLYLSLVSYIMIKYILYSENAPPTLLFACPVIFIGVI